MFVLTYCNYYATRGKFYITFLSVIYEFSQSSKVFVPGKPLQLGLMYASKARAYMCGVPFSCSILR
jgi:hypothetical protein